MAKEVTMSCRLVVLLPFLRHISTDTMTTTVTITAESTSPPATTTPAVSATGKGGGGVALLVGVAQFAVSHTV